MRKISKRVKDELKASDRMRKCVLCDSKDVEYHHTWIYAGRQIDEAWAIIPLCKKHHDMVDTDKNTKEKVQNISLKLASDEDLQKYSKKDWHQLRKYLNMRQAEWKEEEQKKYTNAQRRSLHLFCTWLAGILNDGGLDQRAVLKQSILIEWDMKSVKKKLFKPILKSKFHLDSTEDMKTGQPKIVHKILAKHLEETFPGIEVPDWPSKEGELAEKNANKYN